jgi:16S rRNA (cytidine1402-2'-O)-methyltransferase
MEKILYIVATPIGNLGDISFRALEVLKGVDFIICEDTRHTKRLLDHYEISKPLVSLHQHSDEGKIKAVLEREGDCAYVSDAGTPGISDPGGKVVESAVALGMTVVPIPGASAVIAALSASGLPTDKFMFMGFMPHKGRQKVFDAIVESPVTVALYESPHRILKTLEQLTHELSENRQVVVARELTKKFETIYRGNAQEVFEAVQEKPKGEFVVIIGPKKKGPRQS